jgi:hypothetical protein
MEGGSSGSRDCWRWDEFGGDDPELAGNWHQSKDIRTKLEVMIANEVANKQKQKYAKVLKAIRPL